MNFGKHLGWQVFEIHIAVRFNRFSSFSIRTAICICCVIFTFFNVLSGYIHVSFSLLAVPTVVCYAAVFNVVTQRSEDRFRDKAPLTGLYPVQVTPSPALFASKFDRWMHTKF